MSRGFIIAGTDTDVGKTVFAAALLAAIDGAYWKPIQAGLEGGGDKETVRWLSGLGSDRIAPELYRLKTPASPHRAAELDGVEIDVDRLVAGAQGASRGGSHSIPDLGPLVIETAGGLLVPVTRKVLQIDVIARWRMPVVLVARTALGTINHSLLSLEALRRRDLPIHGIAFCGDANDDSERTICEMGGVRRLGRLPRLDPLTPESLRRAFEENFRREDFRP